MNKTRTACGLPIGQVLSLTVVSAVLLLASEGLAGPPVNTGRPPIADARTASAPSGLDPKNISRQDVLDVINSIRGNVIIVDWHGTWDYDNIQDALDAAQDGDTIIVLPSAGSPDGAYVENVVVPDRGITLRSLLPNDPSVVAATVIDGNGTGSVVSFDGPPSASGILEGFTIRNGYGSWGGVSCGDASPTIRSCVITGNYAWTFGGGICSLAGSPFVEDCTISRNEAGARGGGVHSSDGALTLLGCIIRENRSTAYSDGGGGVYCDGATTIDSCTIERNTGTFGGGIRATGATIQDCLVQDNETRNQGGGIYGDVTVINSIIRRNHAGIDPWTPDSGAGGGVYCRATVNPTEIRNCTITENIASSSGAGIYAGTGNVSIANCVLWRNRTATGYSQLAQLDYGGDVPNLRYSCIQDLATLPGVGNTGDDPLLVHRGMHLQAASPCRDAGDPMTTGEGETDVDAEARVVGGRVDMGADEFLDTDDDTLPDWWEIEHFGSATAAEPNDNADLDELENDQEYENHRDPLRPPYSWYVDPAGNDEWDGLAPSWDGEHGPKATIVAAVEAASEFEGDDVNLASGTYSGEGNRDIFLVGKELTLRSMSGAAGCLIDCQGLGGGFVFDRQETANTALENVTIVNGDPALSFRASEPTVSGCVLIDGRLTCSWLSSPTVESCTVVGGGVLCEDGASPVIRASRITGCSPTALSCQYSTPTIQSCVLGDNSGGLTFGAALHAHGSWPVLANCLIVGNSGHSGAIGSYQGSLTLTNCSVLDNSSDYDYAGVKFEGSYGSILNVTDSVFWGNMGASGSTEEAQIRVNHLSYADITYSCIQGLATIEGDGNIGADPMLVAGPLGCYYLSHAATGQPADSPCIDAGSDTAANLGLDMLTTRRDEVGDAGIVDMGYHYPVSGLPFIRGDLDHDGDVDLDDFAEWASHMTGPCTGAPCWPAAYPDPCGNIADFNDDGDIDMRDFSELQQDFGQ